MTPAPPPSLNAGTLTVTLPGDLLSTTVEAARHAVHGVLGEPQNRRAVRVVELDLRHTRLLDSAGLNLLVSLVRPGREQGFTLRVLVASATLLRTLQFTRMDQLLELVPTVPPPA